MHNIGEFCTSVERLAWAKASGCHWGVPGWGGLYNPCALAAKGGHLEVLQWARARGTYVLLPRPLREGTWRCCGGRGSTGAHGTKVLVHPPLMAGTWRCCGGRGSTTARGAQTRASSPLRKGTWRCCDGRGRTGARGIIAGVTLFPGGTLRLMRGCMRNHNGTNAAHHNTQYTDADATSSDVAMESDTMQAPGGAAAGAGALVPASK